MLQRQQLHPSLPILLLFFLLPLLPSPSIFSLFGSKPTPCQLSSWWNYPPPSSPHTCELDLLCVSDLPPQSHLPSLPLNRHYLPHLPLRAFTHPLYSHAACEKLGQQSRACSEGFRALKVEGFFFSCYFCCCCCCCCCCSCFPPPSALPALAPGLASTSTGSGDSVAAAATASSLFPCALAPALGCCPFAYHPRIASIPLFHPDPCFSFRSCTLGSGAVSRGSCSAACSRLHLV